MKTIYKYVLEVQDEQVIKMPQNSKILSVQIQRGTPCIWALVDTDNQEEDVKFRVVGTGHNVDFGYDHGFIGTFQSENGFLVFHLFRKIDIIGEFSDE